MAAKLLASATGPRMIGSATVAARAICPALASTVCPSSHGRGKIRWSLAEIARKPSRSAISAYSRRPRRDQCRCPFREISGRCSVIHLASSHLGETPHTPVREVTTTGPS
jgi:hypothetical protein